jgi:hypothetical protein
VAPNTPALNLVLLSAIVAATLDANVGFSLAPAGEAAALAAHGYVEVAPGDPDPAGNIATRATPAGIEYSQSLAQTAPPAVAAPQPFGAPAAAAPAAAPAVAVEKPVFTLVSLPVPEAVRKSSAGKPPLYPLDTMEVGQAFFVEATDKRPEPWKSMTSTLQSARMRHAVATGEMKSVTREGVTKQVPAVKYTRDFSIHEIKDGAQFGPQYAGKAGAGIWRTA